jgi:hypothetical protein
MSLKPGAQTGAEESMFSLPRFSAPKDPFSDTKVDLVQR